MAGIGFELKKLFRRKGLLAGLRAYGCAGILCTGPMLLGVLLQLGILVLCGWAGAAKTEQGGPSGLHGDGHPAGFAHRNEPVRHAGDPVSGGHAL